MFKHSLLITFITLFVLSTYFDALSDAKCHRSRRRRNNCCCGCKEEQEGEGKTTPQNNILSSLSGPNSPVSTSVVPVPSTVQSISTAGPSSIVSTNEAKTSQSCNYFFSNFKKCYTFLKNFF